MDDAGSKIATVVDHGNSVELAMRLSREFKKVNYFKPWTEDRPTTNKRVVGDGFSEITRIHHLFDSRVMEETDIFIFPEIYDGDLQVYLENLGKRVWGSRMAEKYEFDRGLFLKTLEKTGLPCPEYKILIGINELKKFMAQNDDWWIKLRMRGDGETWHHKNLKQSQRKIEAMEYQFGPVKDYIEFVAVKGIDSKIEVAYDGFLIASASGAPQFPATAFQGYEHKNKAHILAAISYNDLCDEIKQVNERFAPVLCSENYRSAWGTEIKVTDDTFFFLDATCRQPSPPGEIVMELVKNLGEVIWHGSAGDLVELQTETKFASQVTLHSSWASDNWQPIEIPDNIRRWVKLYSPCQTDDGLFIVPPAACNPLPFGNESIGVVIGLGDTIEEANEAVKEHCEAVDGFDVSNELEALAECLSRIKKGEDDGIEFGAGKIPDAASVLGE